MLSLAATPFAEPKLAHLEDAKFNSHRAEQPFCFSAVRKSASEIAHRGKTQGERSDLLEQLSHILHTEELSAVTPAAQLTNLAEDSPQADPRGVALAGIAAGLSGKGGLKRGLKVDISALCSTCDSQGPPKLRRSQSLEIESYSSPTGGGQQPAMSARVWQPCDSQVSRQDLRCLHLQMNDGLEEFFDAMETLGLEEGRDSAEAEKKTASLPLDKAGTGSRKTPWLREYSPQGSPTEDLAASKRRQPAAVALQHQHISHQLPPDAERAFGSQQRPALQLSSRASSCDSRAEQQASEVPGSCRSAESGSVCASPGLNSNVVSRLEVSDMFYDASETQGELSPAVASPLTEKNLWRVQGCRRDAALGSIQRALR